MRILDCTYDHTDNPWCGGGGAIRVSEINRRLAAAGHRITVIHGSFPGARVRRRNGVIYRPVGLPAPYVVSRLSYALAAPFVMQSHAADIVVNQVSYFAPVFADRYTRRPVVNVVHHLMGRHALRINPAIGWFPYLAEHGMLRSSRHIITPAAAVREEIVRRYPETSVTDVPNGVPDAYYRLIPSEEPFILFLGRIDIYMKGLDLLLDAFAAVDRPEVRLKIAGGGKAGDVRRLKQLVESSSAARRIDVLGRVSETDKRDLLRTCLFLAMPSRFEGWGITATEANAAGKPVIGTRIQGLSEAVREGEGAVLVPPESEAPLTEAVERLIADSAFRKHQGQMGRRWAKQFSWDRIAEQQLDGYRDVLKSGAIR